MARPVPLILWKPLWITLAVLLVLLGSLLAFDIYLKGEMERIRKLPSQDAAAALEDFLASHGWSRHRTSAQQMLQQKLLEAILDKQATGDPDGALKICLDIQRRHDRGAAVERCNETLMDLRVDSAKKKIAAGQFEQGLSELEACIAKGLRGESLVLARQEAARAHFELMSAASWDRELSVMEAEVEKVRQAYPNTEGSGLASDLITCRKLRSEAPRAVDAAFLQGVLRCQEVVRSAPQSLSGRQIKAFLAQLDRSVVVVHPELIPSPKLPRQPTLQQELESRVVQWLMANQRTALFPDGPPASPTVHPTYRLELSYRDEPGKAFGKDCRSRKMSIGLELKEAGGGSALGAWRFTSNDKELKVPAETMPEDCQRVLLDKALDQLAAWLKETVANPFSKAPSAWGELVVPEPEVRKEHAVGPGPQEDGRKDAAVPDEAGEGSAAAQPSGPEKKEGTAAGPAGDGDEAKDVPPATAGTGEAARAHE